MKKPEVSTRDLIILIAPLVIGGAIGRGIVQEIRTRNEQPPVHTTPEAAASGTQPIKTETSDRKEVDRAR